MNAKTLNGLLTKSRAMVDLPQGRLRHFSFILRRNKILSFGWNQKKTHTLAWQNDYKYMFIHSELAAIKNFPGPPSMLADCVLVNTRIGLCGDVLISKPCRTCQRMIEAFDFKQVIYTTEKGWQC